MKLPLFILISLIYCSNVSAQWTWVHGDSLQDQPGNFGIQGVSAPSNKPPSLYESCEWTDLNGNFWLFGGIDHTGGVHNALWKYNVSSNEWTWMKGSSISNDTGFYGIQGVANVNNNPPPRKFGFVSWVSQNGDLWLFGGGKTSSTTECYNDLWKYSVITNEWTWVKGPNVTNQAGIFGNKGIANPLNNPSPRMETAASWTDDIGNLWLFGGIWYGVSRLNDLWKYNIATNQWTWMKGDSTINANGQYGMLGIENSANNPPSRWIYSHWKDNDGNFWIFGGNGGGWLSDLWKYNVSSNNWTWINGDSTINTINNYGIKCIASQSNTPGGRVENRASWSDSAGNFLFFGGSTHSNGLKNDIWKYCIDANQWVWISGDSIGNPTGYWGNLGVPNVLNKPNRRTGSVSWKDNLGNIYLFGGGRHNDLWKYVIDSTCGICPTTTSIQTQQNSNDVEVYPNPINDILIIVFNKRELEKVNLVIYDVLGKSVYQQFYSGIVIKEKQEIDISSLAKGLYFIEISSTEYRFVQKIEKP